MSVTQFERNAAAVERLTNHYKHLREQGVDRSAALTHVAQRFGIQRYRVATLVMDWEAGFHDSKNYAPAVHVVSGGMMDPLP